jgi:dCTP diphosphatase
MIDNETTLAELKLMVQEFVTERDWVKYHTPRNLAESISIESAELMEMFQWLTDEEAKKLTQDPVKLERVKEELADVMNYCLSLANAANIDISQAILDKIEKNKAKYPIDQVKGKYRKYHELKLKPGPEVAL